VPSKSKLLNSDALLTAGIPHRLLDPRILRRQRHLRRRGAGIDPVPFAGIAANNLEIALFRELRTLNRR